MNTASSANHVGTHLRTKIMKQYVMSVKKKTPEEKEHNRKKFQQIQARKRELEAKWTQTNTKSCPVCGSDFITYNFKDIACSYECHKELKRCQN
ncbi:MAG: hypothetical protein HOE64_17110 [Nitrospina sp.]|jgi:hypothetical protein|nr:hypothetical protein [Nitrospina sp.]